jgi:hypothetical protein
MFAWKCKVKNSYKYGMIHEIFTLMHITCKFKSKHYYTRHSHYRQIIISSYHHTRIIYSRTVVIIILTYHHFVMHTYTTNPCTIEVSISVRKCDLNSNCFLQFFSCDRIKLFIHWFINEYWACIPLIAYYFIIYK